MREEFVIIVAGGTGSRMNSDRPKQFLELNGLPVIIHTLRKFLTYNPGIRIIISVHKDYLSFLQELLLEHEPAARISVTEGGATRYHSVYNGLKQIKESHALVAIHDAARPLVSVKTIRTCFETASEKGNAVPVITLSDSLRLLSEGGNVAVDRTTYRIVQTPQCFLYDQILSAFSGPYQSYFTDDASVLEASGEAIHLVEGNVENIKITSPHDLLLAAALLNPADDHAE